MFHPVKLKFAGTSLEGQGTLMWTAAGFNWVANYKSGLLPPESTSVLLTLKGELTSKFCMIKSLYQNYPHWFTHFSCLVYP